MKAILINFNFFQKNAKGIFHRKIRGIIENFVHDHEKFDEASMKRRKGFDDGIFDAMCTWALDTVKFAPSQTLRWVSQALNNTVEFLWLGRLPKKTSLS